MKAGFTKGNAVLCRQKVKSQIRIRYGDTMDDMNFCPSCGKNLEPGEIFCPACGRPADGRRPVSRDMAATGGSGNERRITIALILLIINAVIFFFRGMSFYTAAADMAEQMMESFPDLAAAYYTVETLTSFIQSMAILIFVIGAVCLLTGAMAYMRRFWTVTFILCIITAILGFMTLTGIIIGLMAAYMLYKARPSFKS
jgi:predicted RNA-binding Zn-ribbon protein involved in translation (DUF1610 family)